MPGLHQPFVRQPVPTLVVCLLLLAGAWVWVWPPTFNSSAWVLMQSDQRNLTTYNEMRETLGGLEIIAAVIHDIDVFSDAGAARLGEITDAIKAVPGMDTVTSLTTPDRPVRRGLSVTMLPFIPTEGATPEQWEQVRAQTLSNIIAHNVLVADDGRAAMVLAVSDRDLEGEAGRAALRADLLEAVKPFDGVSLVAYSVSDGEMRETARGDAMVFIPTAIVVITAVLLVTFRRPALVLAMLANQLMVLASLPVLLKVYQALAQAVLGHEVPGGFDLYTNLLLPLTAAIHLALQVHVVSACLRAPGATIGDRIAEGVRRVTRPTVIAAVTTMIGLLSLAFGDIGPVVRFAIVGAASVALAAAFTLGPGLALIRLTLPLPPATDDEPAQAPPQSPEPSADAPGRCLSRWDWPVALVLLALVPGMTMIRTDVRAIEFLSPGSMTRQAAETIDARFGGINLFMIECKVEPADDAPAGVPIHRPSFLRFLEAKRKAITQIDGVGTAYDYSQVFSMINRVRHGDDPAQEVIPCGRVEYALTAALVEAVELPFIEKLRAEEGDTAFILVRTASMSSRDYLGVLERVMAEAQRDVPPGVTVKPRTGLHSVLEQDRKLVADQARSTGITLGAVFLIVLVVWRSPWLAVSVTLASALPVGAMLGLAGYTGTSINSITMMTASVVLGLAVDDGAHLLDASLRRRREGMPWRDAVSAALRVKRKPIICTSVILGSMLGLLGLSSFPPVQSFGLLACLALLAAMAAVLALLPGLMKLRQIR